MSASESVTPRLYDESLGAARPKLHTASTHQFRNVSAAVQMMADFVTCAGGILGAYSLAALLWTGREFHGPLREAAAASLGISLFAVLLLYQDGAYRGSGGLLQIRETERAIRIPVLSMCAAIPFGLLLDLKLSGAAFLIAFVLVPVLLILQKQAFVTALRKLRARECHVNQVVVYGIGDTGTRILSALSCSLRSGLYPEVVIDDDPALDGESIPEMGYRGRRSVPVKRGPITSALLTSCQCSTLIVVLPKLSPRQVAEAVDAANQTGARILFLSATELQEQRWTESSDVDGLSLTPMLHSFEHSCYSVAKRMVDLLVSALLLVLFAPLFFLIAFFIRLGSPGPAIFVQNRVGRQGKIFKMYKFRSLHDGTPQYERSPTAPFDPRITRIGRLLRRSSLDELPQLINVFLGNMSMVGPRPEMPFIAQTYSSEQQQRLLVTPGITGIWQLSADRAFPIHENIQYDLYYIRNRGFFLDIAILMHTLLFAMRGGV